MSKREQRLTVGKSASTNPFDDTDSASTNPFDDPGASSDTLNDSRVTTGRSQNQVESNRIDDVSPTLSKTVTRKLENETSGIASLSKPQESEPPHLPPSVSDVSLRAADYEYVTGNNEKYCLFLIEVSQYGVTMIVKKRFSQIMEFHASLGIKHIKAPPKRPMENQLSEEFVKNRMDDITKFFTELLLLSKSGQSITKNEKVIEFFQLKELEERKKDTLFVQKQLVTELNHQLTTVTAQKDSLVVEVQELKESVLLLQQQLTTTQQELKVLQQKHDSLQKDHAYTKITLATKTEQLTVILDTLKNLLETNEKR